MMAKDGLARFWSVKARQLDFCLRGRLIAELENSDLYPHWTTGGGDGGRGGSWNGPVTITAPRRGA